MRQSSPLEANFILKGLVSPLQRRLWLLRIIFLSAKGHFANFLPVVANFLPMFSGKNNDEGTSLTMGPRPFTWQQTFFYRMDRQQPSEMKGQQKN
jgi:hypothetical protein